ncbi:Translation initiation factor component [Salix suchowensis]|nr:Translation initiation factor component [Salix suchowensis]
MSQTSSLLFVILRFAHHSALRRIHASRFSSGCIIFMVKQNLKSSSLSPQEDICPYRYRDFTCVRMAIKYAISARCGGRRGFLTDHCMKGKRRRGSYILGYLPGSGARVSEGSGDEKPAKQPIVVKKAKKWEGEDEEESEPAFPLDFDRVTGRNPPKRKRRSRLLRQRDREREVNADLSNAAELFGAAALGGTSSAELNSIISFQPRTKEDFHTLSSRIIEYTIKRHQNKPLYAAFVEHHVRQLAMPLKDVEIRKAASGLTTLANEKQKEQREKASGKKKAKATTKPALGAAKASNRCISTFLRYYVSKVYAAIPELATDWRLGFASHLTPSANWVPEAREEHVSRSRIWPIQLAAEAVSPSPAPNVSTPRQTLTPAVRRKNVAIASTFGFHHDVFLALAWTMKRVLGPTDGAVQVYARTPYAFGFQEIVDELGLYKGP